MPFASERQRRFMHSQHPSIASRWEREAKSSNTPAVQKGGDPKMGDEKLNAVFNPSRCKTMCR